MSFYYICIFLNHIKMFSDDLDLICYYDFGLWRVLIILYIFGLCRKILCEQFSICHMTPFFVKRFCYTYSRIFTFFRNLSSGPQYFFKVSKNNSNLSFKCIRINIFSREKTHASSVLYLTVVAVNFESFKIIQFNYAIYQCIGKRCIVSVLYHTWKL